MTSAASRFEQGVRACLAFATPVELQLAKEHLSVKEFDAFCAMSRAEQLHSLNVLRAVLAQSDRTLHPLAVAALLHDVGKSRYCLAVWQKSLCVIVKAMFPRLADWLGREPRLNPWRAPFVVRKQHHKWSADILRACGSDPVAIWLAEHHQEQLASLRNNSHVGLLQRLQRADDAC